MAEQGLAGFQRHAGAAQTPAGVSFENRQVLLGHRPGRITTHYSAVEIAELIDAAEKVAGDGSRKTPELTLLGGDRRQP